VAVDVPTSSDFESAGISSLNMAWQIAYDLLYQEELAEFPTWDDDGTVTDEYWQSAQPILRNALGLIQQAHELALKGRIAAVRPYLLIAQDATRWPVGSGPISFSSFRSIDAVDLPRAMELFAGRPWPKLRLKHLENDPTALAHSSDHAYPTLLREMVKVINQLSPAEAKQFFGVDLQSRWYMCPGSCNSEIHTDEFAAGGDYPRLAQLSPSKTPGAKQLYCFVCGETAAVERTRCNDHKCLADVIFVDESGERVCLTCDEIQRNTSGKSAP
jgi:hypothetical protein